MAEGWARHLKSDLIEAYSAGIKTHGLNPHAVRVMKEAGVDISDHKSKLLADLEQVLIDVVVTVCAHAHENCPTFPGDARVVHIAFDDPPKLAAGIEDREQVLEPYRRVRDEIRDFVSGLPESLERAS